MQTCIKDYTLALHAMTTLQERLQKKGISIDDIVKMNQIEISEKLEVTYQTAGQIIDKYSFKRGQLKFMHENEGQSTFQQVMEQINITRKIVEFACDSSSQNVLMNVVYDIIQSGQQCIILQLSHLNIQNLHKHLTDQQLRKIHMLRLTSLKQLQNSVDLIIGKAHETHCTVIILYNIYQLLQQHSVELLEVLKKLSVKQNLIVFNDLIELQGMQHLSAPFKKFFQFTIEPLYEKDSIVHYVEDEFEAPGHIHEVVQVSNYNHDTFKYNNKTYYIAYDYKFRDIVDTRVICLRTKDSQNITQVLISESPHQTPIGLALFSRLE